MAYNKRTWLGRQGTGLNKFSIGGATPVTIVNQPDSVTQVGDALSAGNLNDLEDRIESGFNDVDTALATKADQTEVTDLKNACSALDKRVTNLELKTGDQFDVDYPSDTYGMDGVPSNVEPYAKVKALRGVGRIANQLVDTTKQSGYNATQNVSGTAFDITTLVLAGYGGFRGINIVTGHVYLFAVDCKTKASSSIRVGWFNSQGQTVDPSFIYLSQGFNTQLFTSSVSGTDNQFLFYGEVGKTDYYDNFIIRDLTVYFNGNIPSNAQTIDGIRQNYPELLIPSDYGTEVVFPTYTAVKSGIKLVNGSIDGSGNDTPSDSRVRSSFVPVSGAITIAIDNPAAGQIITEAHYYNSAKSWLSYEAVSNTYKTLTIPSSCKYLKFILRNSNQTTTTPFEWYGKLLINNVHIEEYFGKLSLPAPVTPKGAGAVSEEYYPETGKVTHPIGTQDLSQLAWTLIEGDDYWWWQASFSVGQAVPSSGSTIRNCLSQYIASNQSRIGLYDNEVSYTASIIEIRTNSKSIQPSGNLYFELATPDPDTYVEPLLDNFVKVEPNGTIEPVQSQSPEVDSAMTVEYMAS